MLALALLALPAWAGADEPEERESEWEMPPAEAWKQEGFRVQLRLGRDLMFGASEGVPDASGISIAVEPGIRLSEDLSLSATLRYSVLVNGVQGLRWTTSADAAWHPFGGLFLGGGIGYAGMIARGLDLSGPYCDGSGVVLLARTGWLIAAGELFSTGPVFQFDEQWTRCAPAKSNETDDFGDVISTKMESKTWRHHTFHFAWSLAWR